MPTLPPTPLQPPAPRADCPWCGSALLAGRRRMRALARRMSRLLEEPESWLDAGTGDAAFPDAARAFFPYTSFDGVDPTPRVLWARAAERVEEAHVGHLTDTGLTDRYDVVTLLHHLEHSPDPRSELTAALRALRPGGHLVLRLHTGNSPFSAADVHTELQDRGCTLLTRRPNGWWPLQRIVARKN
ncbi:class I SAM-dependent methyltransferase [Streptomyces sp. Ru71]|uniref:class I SAM-dependent methyltransferase n=1 Tax=Streptomyces sp. Ru71 TaxID=2080746 RepID=UPI002156646A|nr:class I SAM-dependent methyltransferase [Streptomyces sp. Ru71]